MFNQNRLNDTKCVGGTFEFDFDDNQHRTSDQCCSGSGNIGLKPEGRLSEFYGILPLGQWTLVVEDTSSDIHTGSVVAWSTHFNVLPCSPVFHWDKVNAEGVIFPSARYNPKYIVFEKSLFLFGGLGQRDQYLSDLFRFDLTSNTWTELTPVNFNIAFDTATMVGASFALSSWGVLRFGGYFRRSELSRNGDAYSNGVFVLSPISLKWKLVTVEEGQWPRSRYISSGVFVPASSIHWFSEFSQRILYDTRIPSSKANFAGSLIDSYLIFGGHNGATGTSHDGSNGGMLNDIWQLRFGEWSSATRRQMQQMTINTFCSWRNQENATIDKGCLEESMSSCTLKDLLIFSWCAGVNQTIG